MVELDFTTVKRLHQERLAQAEQARLAHELLARQPQHLFYSSLLGWLFEWVL